MIVKCAWCGKVIGEKSPLEDKSETHGICPDCRKKHFGDIPGVKRAVELQKPGSSQVVRMAEFEDGQVTSCVIDQGKQICCHTAEGEGLFEVWQERLTAPEVGFVPRVPGTERMPRIDPHASALKQDEQKRKQLKWLKEHGFKDAREAAEKGM